MAVGLKETALVLGYAQYTTTSSAFGLLTTPDSGKALEAYDPYVNGQRPSACLLQAEAQNIRWRDDGTDPTTSVGMLLNAGQIILYDGDLAKIRFIAATSGGILNVSYYK